MTSFASESETILWAYVLEKQKMIRLVIKHLDEILHF
jgi:hypothetical protein